MEFMKPPFSNMGQGFYTATQPLNWTNIQIESRFVLLGCFNPESVGFYSAFEASEVVLTPVFAGVSFKGDLFPI